MVTSSKSVSTIQAVDLPVRQVSIFGHQLVIPKDTVCEVEIWKEIEVHDFFGERRVDFRFQILARVVLSHSYFARKTKDVTCPVFETTTENQEWIKKRSKRSGATGFLEPRYWVVSSLEKKLRRPQITDAVLKMFLAGHINRQGLLKFLPKQNCLG